MKREEREKEENGFWEEDLETADPVGNSGEIGGIPLTLHLIGLLPVPW